ncbi:oligosaccharide deacetylase domain-containing protein [Cryptosporidium ubiquitum]|uniref:Oligosaccharide deacetylase domain-containing protein n=1 Tax=Cryptosporidium ubiquitum TaxID=857276 RepID=A0A1J4MP04_9CRYT|nr:oligosaccharide deacetylase domain-containing protein [Cryptosporidium ubiquitum]OII74748.1 oligosaccharide deacetylase domain-containing protein [Cryptosporidium ubiquitum]
MTDGNSCQSDLSEDSELAEKDTFGNVAINSLVSGLEDDEIDPQEMLNRRNSQLYIMNTISNSKSKTGNMFSKTAWETLNKSGTRWAIRSFLRFGRSSFISRSMMNSFGTYLMDAIWWFETNLPVIALTIDDVPGLDPETNENILTLLGEYNIKCTFFVTERNAKYIKNADHFLKRCISEGHELGNHLAKDIPTNKLPISTFTKHLLECEYLISKYCPEHISSNSFIIPPMHMNNRRTSSDSQMTTPEVSLSPSLSSFSSSYSSMVTSSSTILQEDQQISNNNPEINHNNVAQEEQCRKYKWFRPPFGRLTKQQYELVVSRGYNVVMCDVYPNDVSFQGFPQFLAQFCTSNSSPGSIVCLHIPSNSFRSANIEVLKLMLPELSRKFKCVTLSQLAERVYREQNSNSL